jgi:hypothetical protein
MNILTLVEQALDAITVSPVGYLLPLFSIGVLIALTLCRESEFGSHGYSERGRLAVTALVILAFATVGARLAILAA